MFDRINLLSGSKAMISLVLATGLIITTQNICQRTQSLQKESMWAANTEVQTTEVSPTETNLQKLPEKSNGLGTTFDGAGVSVENTDQFIGCATSTGSATMVEIGLYSSVF